MGPEEPTGRAPGASDPLQRLRAYQTLAPWSLRDLAGLAGALLDAARITPLNAVARAIPTERTIRFYVTRGIVNPPEGRGTAATYTYRHLLQVLAVKLRQMEGNTLDAIGRELAELPGDVLERRVATALGTTLPPPDRLVLQGDAPRGRAGRAIAAWRPPDETADDTRPMLWRRLPVEPGLELHVAADHPLARQTSGERAVADAVRDALDRLLPDARA